MRYLNWTAAVSILVCALGCGERDKRLEASVNVVDVETLGGDLAYVQSSGTLQRINVMSDDPQPLTSQLTVRSGPRMLAKRPYTQGQQAIDELLIVSDGRSDSYGEVIDPPALTVVSAAGDTRIYELNQSGQQMRLSDDGQYAVLFNDPTRTTTDTLLTNRNEIAIVDLSHAPSSSAPQDPIIRTIDAVGGAPQGLFFANLKVGGQVIPFVLFSFPKGVSLTQLSDPTDPGHKVELAKWVPTIGSGFAPVQDIRFDSDAGKIYLRNLRSPDVQVLSAAASVDAPGKVDVSQNTLTVGQSAPTDFEVYSPSDGGTRLVATVGKSVAVVAADSNTVTTVPLSYTAENIYTFEGTSPKDNTSRRRALLYGTAQSGVSFVDLEDLEQKTTKAVQSVDLGANLASVLALPTLHNALLIFLTGGGIEVLDLQTRRWSPIGSDVSITASIADATLNRSWVTAPGDRRVGYLDFGDPSQLSLSIGEVKVDDPVAKFFRLDAGTTKRVIVTHNHVGGSLTFFDAVAPSRQSAKKLEGFLLSGLL